MNACAGTQNESGKQEAAIQGAFRDTIQKYEKEIIRQALRNSQARVTRAAKLLGISYQLLVHILEHRHRDLLLERNMAVLREKSIFKKA